jgi:hypothetical protein
MQGCQTFLGTIYQNGKNTSNNNKIYEMAIHIIYKIRTKYMYRMAIKNTKIFHPTVLFKYTKIGFLVRKYTYHLATLLKCHMELQKCYERKNMEQRSKLELKRSKHQILRTSRVARWFIFKPKIPIWVQIWRALELKMLVYFMSMLLPFGIFLVSWYNVWLFGHLYIFPFWYVWSKKNLATLRTSMSSSFFA